MRNKMIWFLAAFSAALCGAAGAWAASNDSSTAPVAPGANVSVAQLQGALDQTSSGACAHPADRGAPPVPQTAPPARSLTDSLGPAQAQQLADGVTAGLKQAGVSGSAVSLNCAGLGVGVMSSGKPSTPQSQATPSAAAAPAFACTAVTAHSERSDDGAGNYSVTYLGIGTCTYNARQLGEVHIHHLDGAQDNPIVGYGNPYSETTPFAVSSGIYHHHGAITLYAHHVARMVAPFGGTFTLNAGGCTPVDAGLQLRCSVYSRNFNASDGGTG